jgi:pyrroline-5-carboxylate reductase
MAKAGEKAGLPPKLAMILAQETVAGAGELLRQSDEEPAVLRKNVTSPNGTTAAALEVLMGEGGMSELLEQAILAAKKRSEELS